MTPQIATMLQKLPRDKLEALVAALSPEEQRAILDDWNLWALPYQRIPDGKWRRWMLRAGRGTGKTLTAARTTNEVARDRKKIRTGEIGIIARTYSEARFTCVEGPSGILATAPSDFQPIWHPGHGLLVWPNGVRGRIFSADKPESMRGPNWAWVWADELRTWETPEDTWWEIIELALRVGWARCVISTTPRPNKFLKDLESRKDTVVTHATTYDNPYLSEEIRAQYEAVYKGTKRGKQELLGEYVEDLVEALWVWQTIERCRVDRLPELTRVIISVDPAITATEKSDETGIIVMGTDQRKHGYVLEDRTGKYGPTEWANVVAQLYWKYRADRVVAEVNQGGDMVEATMRAVDPSIAYAKVNATRAKRLRAEPVAALYERGFVHHVGVFQELENEMTTWIPDSGMPSPNRIDAMVHGATFLQLGNERTVGPISAYL